MENPNPYWNQPPVYPLPKKPSRWQRFRAKSKRFQLFTGCGTLLIVFFACTLCGSVASAVNHSPGSQTTPTAGTTAIVVVATQVPTSTPTKAPTPKPTPTPRPTVTPVPTQAPAPQPTQPPAPQPTSPPAPQPTTNPACAGAVGNNPYCYTLDPNGGSLIYSPPSDICNYLNCITNFWKSTAGYVDECNDGMYSHSGGRSGACSYHGGEKQPLYSH